MEDPLRIKRARAALITGQAWMHLRDLEIGDAGWIASRHGTLYAEAEGFDASFEALVMAILADFIDNRDPDTDRAFVAEVDGTRLGCVFCVREDAQTARLRLFLLEPFARGLGLAPQMLEAVIEHARATGAKKLVLWTHASHEAACKLYRRRGFKMTSERATRSFGQDVVEQAFELRLAGASAPDDPTAGQGEHKDQSRG